MFSITDHTGAWLCAHNDGFLPTFAVDLAGRPAFNLAGCPLDAAPFPGTQLLEFWKEDTPKSPWDCSYNEFMARLNTAIDEAPPGVRSTLLRYYPNRRLSRMRYIVFVQSRRDVSVSAEEAISVIEAIQSPDVNIDLKQEAQSMLMDAGVEPIPDARLFNELYHELPNVVVQDQHKIRVVRPGWVMNGVVLVKSLVELA